MNKINFESATQIAPAQVEINGQRYNITPAVIEGGTLPTPTNMNDLQDNVENGIEDLDTRLTTAEGKIEDLTNKSLWVNPNPTLAFNAQTVNLSSTDFDMYEVVCKRLNSNSEMIVYKAFKNYICYMNYNVYATGTSQVLTNTRTATISGSTCIFSDANRNGETSNINLVPLYVIGYKTGLFN